MVVIIVLAVKLHLGSADVVFVCSMCEIVTDIIIIQSDIYGQWLIQFYLLLIKVWWTIFVLFQQLKPLFPLWSLNLKILCCFLRTPHVFDCKHNEEQETCFTQRAGNSCYLWCPQIQEVAGTESYVVKPPSHCLIQMRPTCISSLIDLLLSAWTPSPSCCTLSWLNNCYNYTYELIINTSIMHRTKKKSPLW